MSYQSAIEVRVGSGTFSCERSVCFEVNGEKHCSIVDTTDVEKLGNGKGLLRATVIAEEGDQVLVDLPRETFTKGNRFFMPRSMLVGGKGDIRR